MIPILFAGDKTTFDNYGLGALSDCASCRVVEERNGVYELEMEYPVDGIHYEDISHSRIILAKPSEDTTPQAFRIYKISKPLNGIVTINAEHISYQLNFIPTGGATASTCQNALNGLKNNAYESCPFSFWTNNTNSGTYKQDLPASIRSRLGGVQGSILDVYGGEYEWDNFTVKLWLSRGSDNGVTLRYGKNIIDIKQEENIENTVTGVCPYWANESTKVTLPEHVLHASTASMYPFQRTMVLDCSSDFESQPTESELRQFAQNYMVKNNIGYPSVNISVSFVALWQTEEYKDIAPLEKVKLCDSVHIYYEKLGISGVAKVIKTTYDVLAERYESIELGDAKSTLGDTIRGEIQDETRDKVTNQELMDAVQRATALITGNEGGYLRFTYNANGEPIELLIMDTASVDTATKVWRWNQNGLGYSSTGYNGTYSTAITKNGEIVADFIATGTLSAVDIQAINNLTGYFTKIHTSTGCFEWNMANSSMATDGTLTARGVNISSGTAKLYGDTLEVAGHTLTGYNNGNVHGVQCSDYLAGKHLLTHQLGADTGDFYHPIISSYGNVRDIYYDGNSDSYLSVSWLYGGDWLNWGFTFFKSDKKFKKAIKDSKEDALSVIEKIRHRAYTWKKSDKKVALGYIANELDDDFVIHVKQPDGDDLLQVDERRILPYVTKAIQELLERVETLEAEVKSLKEEKK